MMIIPKGSQIFKSDPNHGNRPELPTSNKILFILSDLIMIYYRPTVSYWWLEKGEMF
jgi:hypothetical protein